MKNNKTIAIISDTITGPLLASFFEKNGHNCILISTSHSSSSQLTDSNDLNGRIQSFPVTAQLTEALEHLQNFYAPKIIQSERESVPLTIDGGEQKDFVGFADSKAQAVTALSKYNHTNFYNLDQAILKEMASAISSLKAKTFFQSELSALHFVDSKLEKLSINGSQEIVADEFIFLISPKEYIHLVPSEFLNAKTRSRVPKTQAWARVALRFDHQTFSQFEPDRLIFLVPESADVEPCVGYFHAQMNADGVRYFSIWETFVDQNQSEDPEFLTTTLKAVRRWAKKTFSELEMDSKETIIINPHDVADFGWVLNAKDLQDLAENLMITPTSAYPLLGFAQSIICCSEILLAVEKRFEKPEMPLSATSILERHRDADSPH